jgi:phospholipase C
VESNITPWRRAVVGDLTTAFDFRAPNASRRVNLPDTDEFKPVDLVRHPDQVPVPPVDQRVPGQERGVRPARAIPYTLHVDGRASTASFRIDFASSGRAAAVFHVRSAGSTDDPRSYTVEAGKRLTDTWNVGSEFDLSVFGPNGFFRGFKGGQHVSLDVEAAYDERHDEISLNIRNHSSDRATVTVRNRYTSRATTLTLKAGEAQTEQTSLARTRNWYDLAITVDGDPQFEYRYAGHLENGEDSISDPAMGGLL